MVRPASTRYGFDPVPGQDLASLAVVTAFVAIVPFAHFVATVTVTTVAMLAIPAAIVQIMTSLAIVVTVTVTLRAVPVVAGLARPLTLWRVAGVTLARAARG
jgi:hypothetical protein